jgi:hypothetical protein
VLVLLLASPAVLGDDESPWQHHTFDQCYLYRDAEGIVWIHQPIVALGMMGTWMSPNIRLSRELGERLAPVVCVYPVDSKRREKGYDHGYWDSGFERARRGEGPVFLLKMRCETREVSSATWPATTRPARGTFDWSDREVTSAEVLEAEVMSAECIQAWRVLDESIENIVLVSRWAPGPDKTRAITDAIEKGAKAVLTMSRAKVGDDLVDKVKRIEPRVVLRSEYQQYLRQHWQDVLEALAAILRIEPKVELPQIEKRRFSERGGKRFIGRSPENADVGQKWGVTFRRANADLLADKLLLSGIVVEEVAGQGLDLGFKKGDIIIDYTRVYDLTMGGRGAGDGLPVVPSRRHDGKVEVLRGDQVIELTVPN